MAFLRNKLITGTDNYLYTMNLHITQSTKILLFIGFVIVNTLTTTVNAQSIQSGSFKLNNKTINYQIEVLTEGLNFPWSLDFLPDGSIIISERVGNLKIYKQGQLSQSLDGLPDIYVKSQGGLFDVLAHPDFATNKTIYLSFAHGTPDANTTKIISAQLNATGISNLKDIFAVSPQKDTPVHYGGRMTLMPDQTLLLTTGDGFDYREKAQDLGGLLGKIVRIHLDGTPPENNPFVGNAKARDEIYSYGHRNPQAILYDSQRQKIVMHEHGPAGGDEINIIEPGKNYGWPVITHGRDYSGASISPFTEYQDMQQPLLHWTPSIAPSGMAVYYGEQFPELNGALLVGALVEREVRLVMLENSKPVEQISLFKNLNQRIRDVRLGPQGAIYLLTDSDNGQLIKVTRAEQSE